MIASRVVLTYGTFDLFHVGHLRLLARLRALGDKLIVGVSTDEFNAGKGKRSYLPYEHRAEIVGALKVVDLVIPEVSWDQKRRDIAEHHVATFGMGSDWAGKFDDLKDLCDVVYLPRTEDVSSTQLRALRLPFGREELQAFKDSLDAVGELLERLT